MLRNTSLEYHNDASAPGGGDSMFSFPNISKSLAGHVFMFDKDGPAARDDNRVCFSVSVGTGTRVVLAGDDRAFFSFLADLFLDDEDGFL